MIDLELLQRLLSAYGPAGEEDEIRSVVGQEVEKLGLSYRVDPKGNLLVQLGTGSDLIVTAHLDEIAMITTQVSPDGTLSVGPIGGIYPWKLGECAVAILADSGPLNGVLGFGSIHSDSESGIAKQSQKRSLAWTDAKVSTGLTQAELVELGVRPGTRVVLHKSARNLIKLGPLIGAHYLDDRADILAWLMALKRLKDEPINALFAATTAEEVGGEGAQYLLHKHHPSICLALELGPIAGDSSVELSPAPTVWTHDSYSTMASADIRLVEKLARAHRIPIQFQTLSRGGSDASCAAGRGLCARPFTFGLPMENSHGFEIIHPDSIDNLAKLTTAFVKEVG